MYAYTREYFDWEIAIIARNATEKALEQSLMSFNNFRDRERKAFWWDGVLKKASELNEINRVILELEATADD